MGMRRWFLATVTVLCLPGCGREGLPPADQTYTVRGEVDGLPGPKSFLSVHHEAVPGFVASDGAKSGMREMIMDFPDLAKGVSLVGLEIGDPVEMVWEVRWKSDPRILVTTIRELPAGTKLNLTPPE